MHSLSRQNSSRGFQEVSSRSAWITLVLSAIMLTPAIACLVIATSDEAADIDTICDGKYSMDLVTFLEIAGGFQVGFGGLQICYLCSTAMMEEDYNPNGVTGSNGLFGLFYLVLAAVGMSMWENEMSSECQSTTVAEMVLAWSVIQYALVCSFVLL